jgi:cell division septum initiation protein DivIVA
MQKKILKFLKDENEDLNKEIEDLKKEIKISDIKKIYMQKKILNLKYENENLKKKIKKFEDKISGVDKLSIDEDEIKEMDKKVEGWFL